MVHLDAPLAIGRQRSLKGSHPPITKPHAPPLLSIPTVTAQTNSLTHSHTHTLSVSLAKSTLSQNAEGNFEEVLITSYNITLNFV